MTTPDPSCNEVTYEACDHSSKWHNGEFCEHAECVVRREKLRLSPLHAREQYATTTEHALQNRIETVERERDDLRADRDRLRDTVVWVLENVDELEGSWRETVEDMSGVKL